jgi:hypothetical protein
MADRLAAGQRWLPMSELQGNAITASSIDKRTLTLPAYQAERQALGQGGRIRVRLARRVGHPGIRGAFLDARFNVLRGCSGTTLGICANAVVRADAAARPRSAISRSSRVSAPGRAGCSVPSRGQVRSVPPCDPRFLFQRRGPLKIGQDRLGFVEHAGRGGVVGLVAPHSACSSWALRIAAGAGSTAATAVMLVRLVSRARCSLSSACGPCSRAPAWLRRRAIRRWSGRSSCPAWWSGRRRPAARGRARVPAR